MDILIAMIIGGVVISMAVTYFLHLQKYLADEQNKGDTDTQITLLQLALTNDFHHADIVTYRNKMLEFNHGDMAEYQFGEEYVVRSDKYQHDTFALVTKSDDVVYLSEKDNIVKSFTLVLDMDKDMEQIICLRKKYSAVQLYNNENLQK